MAAFVPLFVKDGHHPLGERRPCASDIASAGLMLTGGPDAAAPGGSPVLLLVPIGGAGRQRDPRTG